MRTINVKLLDGIDNPQTEETEKDVTLRALITSDLVGVISDYKVKQLLKEDFTIDMQAATALMSGDTSAVKTLMQDLKMDPIRMMATQGALAVLFCTIFPKVIIKFGKFEKQNINSSLIGKLTHRDFSLLV